MLSGMGTRIPPLVVAVLAALLEVGVAAAWPGARVLPGSIAWAGGLMAGLAVLIVAAAMTQFVRARTTVDPHRPARASVLVTGGVFAFTRNPMYLAMLLALVGIALGLRNPLAVIGPILFAAYITVFQIVPEERVLLARFGAAYQEYCQRVRRWI